MQENTYSTDPIITPKQFAARFGVSDSTIKRMAGRNEISHTKVGNRYRFSEADLQDFMQRNEHPVKEPREHLETDETHVEDLFNDSEE